ncbi:MAG: cohesin domain-containing protein [Bacteroidetes bacterium]|nr:cohesin domain-containing protein [Bacteroidota bacterium]
MNTYFYTILDKIKTSVLISSLCLATVYPAVSQEIKIDAVEGNVNDSLTVPIYVNDLNAVGSFTLYVTFNASLLAWGSTLNLNTGLTTSSNYSYFANVFEDTVVISWMGLTPLFISGGKLLDIRFFYKSAGTSELDFTSDCEITDILGNTLQVTYLNGMVVQHLSCNPAATSSSICLGGSAQLISNPIGGFGNYSYSWTSVPAGFSSTLPEPVVTPSQTTTYNLALSDGFSVFDTSVVVTVLPITAPGEITNLFPPDSTVETDRLVTLSWYPSYGATKYNIYLWKTSDPIPTTPTVSGLTSISYAFSQLVWGAHYYWKIMAENSCAQTESEVHNFSIRTLPELHCSSLSYLPVVAGDSTTITWTVVNDGPGITVGNWYDHIYISADIDIRRFEDDILLAKVQNLSYLTPGQSYTNSKKVKIPLNHIGSFYIFVISDSDEAAFIDWAPAGGQPVIPYQPSITGVPYPYLFAYPLHNYNGTCIEVSDNGLFHDNFFYDSITVGIPPLPDLKVVSVDPQPITFSGQPNQVKWIIMNNGNAPVTVHHFDNIYLSINTILDDDDLLLGSFLSPILLQPDSSYTVLQNVTVPLPEYGRFYFIVQTDATNIVYEYLDEDNDTMASDTIHIFLPSPAELKLLSVQSNDTANNNEPVTVSWTVKNEGISSIGTIWYDHIYLSNQASNPNLESAILLGSQVHSGGLLQDSSYTNEKTVNIPSGITGNYYVFLKTDALNNIFELNKSDNINLNGHEIQILSSDLKVCSVNLPSVTNPGIPVSVSWKVTNQGTGKIINGHWTDRIFYSASAIFNPQTSTQLAAIQYNGIMNSGDTLQKQCNITFPQGLTGNYYLFIFTDANNQIFESDENNNLSSPIPIQLNITQWPDLQVISINFPFDTIKAGYSYPVNFTVKNIGNIATPNGTWTDKLFLSFNPTWNSNVIEITGNIHQGIVGTSSQYTVNVIITIPISSTTGTYYLFAYTDITDQVFEYTGNNNNSLASGPVYIKAYPPGDLSALTLLAPDSAHSGQPMNMQWTVKNVGIVPTLSSEWKDAVYLSTDTLIQPGSDVLLGHYQHFGKLNSSDTYTNSVTVSIPNGFSGNYYLLMETDYAHQNPDVDLNNNVVCKEDISGLPKPIWITLTPPSNLVISDFSVPTPVKSGQPANIKWSVHNTGTGITTVNSWSDKIFLSTNPVVNYQDYLLGTVIHNGVVGADGSYSDSISVTIPSTYQGYYYVIIKTDFNNAVYESNEEDNTRSEVIQVIKPLPCDLVISSLTAPSIAICGDTVNVGWEIANNSVNPVSGFMKQGVYLSNDQVFDNRDVLIGFIYESVQIPPQGSINQSVAIEIPGVTIGNYYLMVKADILNNIPELNENNNLAVSPNPVIIDVKNLPLETATSDQLSDYKNLYFKIIIPSGYQKESLLITLKADSIDGNNEVYARFEKIPDPVNFDVKYSEPFRGNQSLTIPILEEGTYYLLVKGSTTNGNIQSISLIANKLMFEIRNINPLQGGNTGQVTIAVEGSKFDTIIDIRLENNSGMIVSDKIVYINPALVFSTFNLQGEAVGLYDVVAERPGGMVTRFENAFEIVEGTISNIRAALLHPASARPNRVVGIRVDYTNTGNVDVVDLESIFTSLSGAPVGYTTTELDSSQYILKIPFNGSNSPPGSLPPGSSGSAKIFTRTTSQSQVLQYKLIYPKK